MDLTKIRTATSVEELRNATAEAFEELSLETSNLAEITALKARVETLEKA